MPPEPYYHDAEAGITIYCGDCRGILPTLAADLVMAGRPQVDVLFADPPYGVGFTYQTYNDERGDAYQAFLSEVQPLIASAAPTRFVTPGISNLWRWPEARWVLCWYKPGSSRRSDLPQPNRPQGGFNEWEPVLVYGRPRFMSDVVRLPAVPQADTGDHPCPKPLKLLEWLLTNTPGCVLDPFMGSGTTLVAAK